MGKKKRVWSPINWLTEEPEIQKMCYGHSVLEIDVSGEGRRNFFRSMNIDGGGD